MSSPPGVDYNAFDLKLQMFPHILRFNLHKQDWSYRRQELCIV